MPRHRISVPLSIAALVVGAAPAHASTESLPEVAHTVITGAEEGTAAAGPSLDSAGDFDGDGIDDLVAGGRNVAYVIAGGARGSLTTEDERVTRLGFVVDNPHHQVAVAGTGDVDGDGFDDVLVGAPRLDSDGERNAGAAFLVFGRPDPQDLTLDGPDALRVVRIDGEEATDRTGYSVAGAGDVDGDGSPDVLVGARGAGAGDRGAAYVLFGRALTAPIDLSALGGSGFRIHDPARGAGVGYDVASAGDMNRDGFGDVVVGVPSINADAPPAAYVVFGSAEGGDVRLRDLGARGWLIRGSKSSAHAGAGGAVAGGHDVNGDGIPDVLVGAREAAGRYGHRGAAFVLFGKADPDPVRLGDIAEHGFRIDAGDRGSVVGYSVALVPDLDGNGLSDVLVGDPLERRKDSWGAVYHLVGSSSHERIDLGRLGSDGVRYVTRDESFVGTSVGAPGDFDGDGTPDVAAAAPQDPASGVELGGAIYVFAPVEPPPNDPPPRARIVSYSTIQHALLGSYCWDGLCVDRRPAFPPPRVAGTGDRAHFEILYDRRPDDFGLTVYRELDEFGRPAGAGHAVATDVRPVRRLEDAPVAAYQGVFRLPRLPRDVYLAGFARWEGLDRGDVSWFAHLRLERGAAHVRLGRPPRTTLLGDGLRVAGALGSHCWRQPSSHGTSVSRCSDYRRTDPLPARAAGAGDRASVRIHSQHRPDRVGFRFYREESGGFPSGESTRVRFWLRRHRVDGETRAWEVRFRLPGRRGHVYPLLEVAWRGHGTAPYDWHLRLR
jgi:hypothetical protein